MLRFLSRALFGLLITAALLYGGDFAWVRLRMANHQNPLDSLQVRTLLAVPLKNNRVEYIPGAAETRTCVQSLFPQLGVQPCWYLSRHTHRVVEF